nr:reverse transcriptase domain-containing protein [Tanacetum cinerariifolium]
MNTNEQTPLSQPTSVVRNTLGREQAPQNLVSPVPDEDLREYCDKNYHQILPIIAEKLHQEKEKKPQGKVGTQGCQNQIHKPGTEARPFQIAKGEGSGEKDGVQKIGESRREAENCYQSSRSKETEMASEKHRYKREYSRRTKAGSESEESAGGHWKSKQKKQKSSMEDDLSQPWVCEETDPFTPRIHYFDFPKTQMPSHIKTYDGSEDPKDHLKIFQAAAKTERWPVPTWCHMFNSTLTENARVWFDDLPKESIDIYNDLKKAFLENYLQQKKCIKDPVEIHNIKQKMGIHERVCEEGTKKSFPFWKQETGQKQNFKRGNFRNEQRLERKQDKFTLLTKTPREILALDKGKFKPPPPMNTPVEKRNASKFCEFHREAGHTTDECMHLKRKIEEMLKARKLSHLIKVLKQNNGKDQEKTAKKGETFKKDKPLAILMVQPWQRIARQRITQTFSLGSVIFFPTLGEEDGTKGPMIIKADMGGHCVHRIYVDGGSSSEILKDRRRGTLNIRSDEFHGGEITLSLQRDYRKAGEPKVSRPSINQVKEEKIQVAIHSEHPEETVAIGSTLTEEGRKELCGLLRRHLDVFAWKPADMTGVPRHIAEHRLNVREGCLPVRQKKRGKRLKEIKQSVRK